MTHHSFNFSLAHEGEKSRNLDRAERKRLHGGYRDEPGWLDDLPTRVWRMRLLTQMQNIALAAASKLETRRIGR